jgi:Tfp pilus assembly protein PilX
MALTLTLSVLVALTVPMLALLSISALEPLIARNLVDASRAFYLAEAGIEWALTQAVETPTPDPVALGPGPAPEDQPPAGPAGQGSPVNLTPPAALLPWGTSTITARSDLLPGVVILTSTGTVNGAQRTIEVAVRPPRATADGSEAPGGSGKPGIVSWRER